MEIVCLFRWRTLALVIVYKLKAIVYITKHYTFIVQAIFHLRICVCLYHQSCSVIKILTL